MTYIQKIDPAAGTVRGDGGRRAIVLGDPLIYIKNPLKGPSFNGPKKREDDEDDEMGVALTGKAPAREKPSARWALSLPYNYRGEELSSSSSSSNPKNQRFQWGLWTIPHRPPPSSSVLTNWSE